MRAGRAVGWAASLLFATSCGVGGDTREPGLLSPEQRAIPSAELPHTGVVADAPTGAITVGIVADGTLLFGAQECGLEELLAVLLERARDPETREPDGSSKLDLVLRVDRRVPWTLVQWVLQTVSDPRLKLYRTHFAVAPEAGGEDGVIETFLPKDGSIGVHVSSEPGRPIRANLFAHEGTPDRGAVFAAIRALVVAGARTVELGTPMPRIPRAGHVLTVLDLALRAGATNVEFVGAPSPLPRARDRSAAGPATGDAASEPRAGSLSWLRAWVARWSKENADGYEVLVGAERITAASGASGPPLPSPPPRRAARPPTAARIEEDVPVEDVPPTPEELEQVHEVSVGAEAPGGRLDPVRRGGAFSTRGEARPAREGTSREADSAVEAALTWLAAHQSADGDWEAEGFGRWCDRRVVDPGPGGGGKAAYDVGVTGLALLAFLGAGYTNRSPGPFGRVVGDGLRYLKNVQDAEGCFGGRSSPHFVYDHAIAALAMIEAFGMTGSPLYPNSTQKALDFIASARNPGSAWRYGVRPGDNDTSVTAWMALALWCARLVNLADEAAGRPASLVLDEGAIRGIRAWIDRVTDSQTGRVGYQQRGTGPARPVALVDRFPGDRSEAMTAMGVLARMTSGEDPAASDPIRKGVDLMSRLRPRWDPSDGSLDFYYWHAGSLAMFQVGGEAWKGWQEALHTAVLPHQRTDGDACGVKGSWDPVDAWGAEGGRVYATALLACTLETPDRYVRVSFPAK